MTHAKNDDKLSQYNEFFSIAYKFNINITPLTTEQVTNFDDFTQSMPMPFQMASDIELLSQNSVKKTGATSDLPSEVIYLLNLQSKKVDLLMDYLLSQQDDSKCRYKANSFGGGGLSFESDEAFPLNQFLEVKIFMLQRHCAIFCYAEVIEVSPCQGKTGKHVHKVVFHFIRESDRESLVRYSLKEQSKQLQSLANERNNQNS
jgi:hypothetical protein